MSAAAEGAQGRGRPPTFFVDVAVDVDPAELEEAGWVYVGPDASEKPDRETVMDVVRGWHDDTHPGHWRFCLDEPCVQLNRDPLR